MTAADVDESGHRARAKNDDDDDETGQSVQKAWRRKGFRLTVIGTAVVLSAGFSFGVGRALGLGNTVVLTAIPKPFTANVRFKEDDDGVGQDNQVNILESTAPGMVHVMSGGTSVGIGLVLTESGMVLTTYRPAPGASGLAAKYVLSGITFTATVIGEADGLTLLQMQGPVGRAFSTVTVGNSDTLVDGSYSARESSYHVPGEVTDTEVGSSGTSRSVIIDLGTLVNLSASVAANGHTRGGLLESVLQSAPSEEVGGPLVDLNGRVAGITVAEGGGGLKPTGYAIPINTALTIATQIDNQAHGS
ncbi:MAG TPA: hypothetical protein VIZ43_03595 [Trebonia sp.]